jgi:hypothetical protein
VRGLLKVRLNPQEAEFAAACRDFVLERRPELGASIVVFNDELVVADDLPTRDAFIDLGVRRLMRVIRLAIYGGAIPGKRIPKVLIDLVLFRRKVLGVLRLRE